jgi:predicted nucleic acid-binding protein
MRVARDTNRYVDLCRDVEGVAETLETAEAVYLPFTALAELRAGFSLGSHGPENERTLRRFLMKDGVSVLYPDEQTTYQYAAVFRQLRSQGTPIPTNDIWVAALVLQHDLALYARDRHFEHLPQLVML